MRPFLALLLACSASAVSATVPRPAGDFVIQLPAGHQQSLTAYKGKTIVLAFLYTNCAHCQKTAGTLTQVQKDYADKGVQVLGATFDAAAARHVKDFNRVLELNYPCGYSNEKAVLQFLQHPAAEPYFVPILVFIDRKFNVRSQYVGDENFLGNENVNIRAEIDKLLK